MAMTDWYQDLDGVEPVSDTFGEQAANSGLYHVVSGCIASYSVSDMVVTVSAGIVTHNGQYLAVPGNTVTLVADPSAPRWTWVGINSSGVAVIVSGDPAVSPAVPEIGDLVSVALVLVQAAQTIANNITTKLPKRVPAPVVPVSSSARTFVEASGQKGFFKLPIAPFGGMVTATPYGDFLATIDAGSIVSDASATFGTLNRLTATGAGTNDCTLAGPALYNVSDWTLVGDALIPSAVDQSVIIGAKATPSSGADENNLIAFRVSGTGNVFFVCDNGGSETTRDYGATGATRFTWRIEVREGGTVVRAYINGTQLGADITTNITATALYAVAGVREGGSDRLFYISEMFGWREVA